MCIRTSLVMAALALSACAGSPEADRSEPGTANDIVDVIASRDGFQVFARILRKTGLDEDLAGSGPFTVLAPTDAAFELLDEGVLEEGLKRKNRRKLTAVVRFHSARGRFGSEALRELAKLETMSGQPVPIAIKGDRIILGTAIVVGPDIEADNGVIHAIDHVLRPPRAFLEAQVQSGKSSIRGGPDAWWW